MVQRTRWEWEVNQAFENGRLPKLITPSHEILFKENGDFNMGPVLFVSRINSADSGEVHIIRGNSVNGPVNVWSRFKGSGPAELSMPVRFQRKLKANLVAALKTAGDLEGHSNIGEAFSRALSNWKIPMSERLRPGEFRMTHKPSIRAKFSRAIK